MQHVSPIPLNLPIEVVRTMVAIVDSGSFTKAGERLGLSQPAVSAQVKKLQVLVGGLVFERGTLGATLTERGRLMLPHARRLLQANDQILSIGGRREGGRALRLGMNRWYVDRVLNRLDRSVILELHVTIDDSRKLSKGVAEGYIDVAVVMDPTPEIGVLLAEWDTEIAWLRSPDFTLGPGTPVPLVHWPGFAVDQLAIDALQAKGMAYRVVVECADFHCRMQAIASGIGVAPWPRRRAWDELVVAGEPYLPALPPVRTGVIARPDLDLSASSELIRALTDLARLETPDARH